MSLRLCFLIGNQWQPSENEKNNELDLSVISYINQQRPIFHEFNRNLIDDTFLISATAEYAGMQTEGALVFFSPFLSLVA